jgi:myo-inositol-1(or 4)-monophosphatase
LAIVHPLVNVAVTAARAAGNYILRHAPHTDRLTVTAKGLSDFVSEVDRGAEAEIIRNIRRYYPDHAILGEESGESGHGDTVWIIDPLDGTTNFLHGIPHYAVSIGVVHRGKPEHAVVYAPCTNDLYTASAGGGAQLNSRRLRVSRTAALDESLIGTGAPFRDAERIEQYLPQLGRVLQETAGIRRAGSAALDLAYVASGRLDGFWELGLKPWDIAAGILLVQEAGGVVSEIYGRSDVLKTGHLLAGNPRIHEALLPLIRPTE